MGHSKNKLKERYITKYVQEDLGKKMVFIGGPRQVGKTTISEQLLRRTNGNYLNWDDPTDRNNILKGIWPAGAQLLVLDEVHKYRPWRNIVKGLYDKRKLELQILVSGSAKLDYYRRGGDSLQGRYFYYRLHPFSVAELGIKDESQLNHLLTYSGFPEPYLSNAIKDKNRWSIQYRSRLVQEDLVNLESVSNLGQIEQLALRLPDLVGSPLSLNALREDLQVAHATIAKWCNILERLYYIFRIYPFGAPAIRAIKKSAKHYHYDWSLVEDHGARLENLVASHLLKWCHFLEDTEGRILELRYFRDVDSREVDFVLLEKGKPILFLECKSSGKQISKTLTGLRYLKTRFPQVRALALAPDYDGHSIDSNGIERMNLIEYLRTLV